LDDHSLHILEFDRVLDVVAALAESAAGREAVRTLRPTADRDARTRDIARLGEAIRRTSEPGAWSVVGRGDLAARLADDDEREDAAPLLDGAGLVEVASWIAAAGDTCAAWADDKLRARFPHLATRADDLPELTDLRERLERSLEPDGRVRDDASPALRRARGEAAEGERQLQRQLEQWARGFGESSYVTRHGDRFVALVPAAGFSRRRGIVHDVSASGQSLFVEPLEACESNNRVLELRARALAEEWRVLRALADEVTAARPALLAMAGVLVEFDALKARARWALEHGGIALEPKGERLRLERARHPLLAMQRPRDQVVPLDLTLDDARILLVSGPNMGGKTVLLKTVGLTALLAHAAMPVLAGEGSRMPELDDVLADIGDGQSLDEGLSTFAAHLKTLAAMAEHAGPRRLLLCDEQGAGTDPEEGAALGRALLERFVERRAWGIVTTHLGSLKRAAAEIGGVASGSLEFDLESMTPRYRFLAGIPGASRALTMAERLGLDPELIARARASTTEESRALERLLERVQETHRALEAERAELVRARGEAREAAEAHAQAEVAAREALEQLRRRLTGESQALLARARELWQSMQREAKRADKSRASAQEIRERLSAVEREADELARRALESAVSFGGATAPAEDLAAFRARLAPGQRVRVTDLNVEAELLSAPDAEGRVPLRKGDWTIQSHVDRLAPIEAHANGRDTASPKPRAAASWPSSEEAPSLEVDLRGMDADEAIRSLDEGLDRGQLTGLSELRIIHGIGRGVLRAAVERHLKNHPQVASSRAGQVGEGGGGVTVAKLR
jgi:DNA mismatch repair protein MutS2